MCDVRREQRDNITKNEGENNVVCSGCLSKLPAVHLFVLRRESRYKTSVKVKLQTSLSRLCNLMKLDASLQPRENNSNRARLQSDTQSGRATNPQNSIRLSLFVKFHFQ